MENRKFYKNNDLIMVTFRTEEGLPFVPLEFMNKLIYSALAKGQELYPVELAGYTFELNHGHLFIRVTDPELVPKFIGYIKQETAHYLNRLLGRRKRTVWCEGYDSPVLLDYQKALDSFGYGILNPVKDCLVSKMSEYPGVSSYNLMMEGTNSVNCTAIARDSVPRIKNPTAPYNENDNIVKILEELNQTTAKLTIDPYCWKSCFYETQQMNPDEFENLVKLSIENKEKEFILARKNKTVIGRKLLKRSSILKKHTPATWGRKMICLSNYEDLRKQFIKHYRSLATQAYQVYLSWKKGLRDLEFPPGMFPPSFPRLSNLNPAMAFT
ncbi:transposase [bacterium]|nr:transposase [bacterium]